MIWGMDISYNCYPGIHILFTVIKTQHTIMNEHILPKLNTYNRIGKTVKSVLTYHVQWPCV